MKPSAPRAARRSNPLQTTDERPREERPFGWASSAFTKAQQTARERLQEAWMIDRLAWYWTAPDIDQAAIMAYHEAQLSINAEAVAIDTPAPPTPNRFAPRS